MIVAISIDRLAGRTGVGLVGAACTLPSLHHNNAATHVQPGILNHAGVQVQPQVGINHAGVQVQPHVGNHAGVQAPRRIGNNAGVQGRMMPMTRRL